MSEKSGDSNLAEKWLSSFLPKSVRMSLAAAMLAAILAACDPNIQANEMNRLAMEQSAVPYQPDPWWNAHGVIIPTNLVTIMAKGEDFEQLCKLVDGSLSNQDFVTGCSKVGADGNYVSIVKETGSPLDNEFVLLHEALHAWIMEWLAQSGLPESALPAGAEEAMVRYLVAYNALSEYFEQNQIPLDEELMLQTAMQEFIRLDTVKNPEGQADPNSALRMALDDAGGNDGSLTMIRAMVEIIVREIAAGAMPRSLWQNESGGLDPAAVQKWIGNLSAKTGLAPEQILGEFLPPR